MKYAAWSTDKNNLLESSSGGIFFEMAKKVCEEGGYVVGVLMDGIKAKYVISKEIETIKKMRGSKYIPSNPANVIRQMKNIKELLLFVGLPCHVEAVKKECNTKNIILCDLKCHGLPKNGEFEKHIEKIKEGRNIKTIRFRDKKAGWDDGVSCISLIIKFSDGEVYDEHDEYLKNYMKKSILREACKKCKRKQVGDITIGDFWGVPPKVKNKMGTSIVIINTKKGKEFFDSIETIVKKKPRAYHYFNMESIKKYLFCSIEKAGLIVPIKKLLKQ